MILAIFFQKMRPRAEKTAKLRNFAQSNEVTLDLHDEEEEVDVSEASDACGAVRFTYRHM
jgi:hypothetical protein